MTRSDRNAGYTLLEMLIVLAVLGLIAGLAGAVVDSGDRERRQKLEAEATSVLLQGRADAIATGRRVVFAASADGRRLQRDTVAAVSAGHVTLTAPLVFDADGLSNGGTLTLQDGSAWVTIAVEPLTGRIRVVQ